MRVVKTDLTGQTFNRLTVVEYFGTNPWGAREWRCRCSCGNEAFVSTTRLTKGNTRSCGCLRDEAIARVGAATADDLTGRTFGRLTAIKRDGQSRHGQLYWLCQCACGNQKRALRTCLVTGRTKSCGCLPRGRKPRAVEASS